MVVEVTQLEADAIPPAREATVVSTEKPYGEILDEMDHETKCAPVENLLEEIIVTMRHARVFLTSREKMHPTGVALYDELLQKLTSRRYPQESGRD